MTARTDNHDHQVLGGDMAWKKALFLGGAVLLLAACSDATAPSSLTQSKRAPVASATASDSTLVGASSTDDPYSLDPVCRSGYYVRSGDRWECIDLSELY